LKVWQHPERADGIMSGGGGILSYHVTWLEGYKASDANQLHLVKTLKRLF